MATKNPPGVVKGIRPILKSGKNQNQSQDEFVLESVCGVSCASKSALASNPANSLVAFAASSVLVFLDPRYSDQDFLENPSGRSINAVAFSDDGKYVAFGEVGYNPNIFIYTSADRKLVSKFQMEGMCSVKTIEFHPKCIYLAVVCGSSFNIGLFEMKGKKLTSATFVVEPLGMTLPKVGSYLVVCGHRKISLFSLMDVNTNVFHTNIVFDRRSVLLGHQSEYTFVDIVSGTGPHIRKVYTVTSCGYLCDLKVGDILIDRAAKVDDHCFCIKYCFGCLFIGCAKNSVKICSPVNLLVVTTISDSELYGPNLVQPSVWKFEADTVAITVNSTTRIVTCVSSDHRRFCWQVDLHKSSIESKAVIPVDPEDKEVAWQPTSFEMQSKIANLLNPNPCHQKSKPTPKEGVDKIATGSNSETSKLPHHGLRSAHFKPTTGPCYVNATRFTPDGKTIICGNTEGEIKIFDALTGRLNRVIEAHSAAVTIIELLFDDHFGLVASGGRDRVIFILDAAKDHSLVQVLCDHSSAIVSISMAHLNGTLTLVSAAADGVILIRRAIKGKLLRFVIVGELSEFGGKPRIYAYGSEYIITGGDNGQFNLFPTEPFISTRPTKTIKSATRTKRYMKAVAIDPSGSFLVANSANGTLVFSIQTGKHLSTLTKMLDVSLITFTNDCRHLVSVSKDGCRFLWRLPNKMSEVMSAKLGDTSFSKPHIPYEKILSCVSVVQTNPNSTEGNATLDMSQGDTQDGHTVATSRLCFQDKSAIISSRQNSPMECGSYSSCTTCSRSYTDVFDYSRKRNNSGISGFDEHMRGFSDEAERLLDNTVHRSAKSENNRSDKDVVIRTPIFSKNRSPGGTVKPLCKATKTPPQSPNRRRKSPLSPRKVNGLQNKASVQNAKKSVFQEYHSGHRSPPSEYLSVDSHESLYMGDHAYGDREHLGLSADSKTNLKSEFISEMNDCLSTEVERTLAIDSINETVLPEPKPALNQPIKDTSPHKALQTLTAKLDSEDAVKATTGKQGSESPRATCRGESRNIVSKGKVLPSPRPTKSSRARASSGDKKKNSDTSSLPSSKKDYSAADITGNAILDNDVKGDEGIIAGNGQQNVNQNTVLSFEPGFNHVYDRSGSPISTREDDFDENTWDMMQSINQLEQKFEKDFHKDERKDWAGRTDGPFQIPTHDNGVIMSPSQIRRLTQLSNSQETFFDCVSEEGSCELLDDLGPINNLKGNPQRTQSAVQTSPSLEQAPEIYEENMIMRETMHPADCGDTGVNDQRQAEHCEKDTIDDVSENFQPKDDEERSQSNAGNDDEVSFSSLEAFKIRLLDDYSAKSRSEDECLQESDEAKQLKGGPREGELNCGEFRNDDNMSSKGRCPEITHQGQTTPFISQCDDVIGGSDLADGQECRQINELPVKSEKERTLVSEKRAHSCNNKRKEIASSSKMSRSTVKSNSIPPLNHYSGINADKEKKTASEREVSNKPIPRMRQSENNHTSQADTDTDTYRSSSSSFPVRQQAGRSRSSQRAIRADEPCQETISSDIAKTDLDAPSTSSELEANSQPSVIEGLGSVVELFRNQDDYLRKLREVRRNFEKSIQALRDDRKHRQLHQPPKKD